MIPQHLDRADVLQSWVLQTAIIFAFALSNFGVAYILRRPAMKSLSVIWALYVCVALAGTAGSALNTGANATQVALFLMTLSPALVVSTFPANLAVIASVADRPRWITAPFATLWFGLGALVLIGGGEIALGTSVSPAFWPRLFTTSTYLVSFYFAFRESRRSTMHAPALRLLAAGFGLMGARVFINILVGSEFIRSSSATVNNSLVTIVQVFSIVLFGAFALLAVLDQERSAILANAERLRDAEANVAASRRYASLGRLSAGIAHDFNNILSTIVAGASLARYSAKNPTVLEFELNAIEDAVRSATDLTRQLQLFARNEESEPVVFDVNKRIEGVSLMLERLLGSRTTLTVNASRETLEVRMDPSRFEQIILNLVANARDAMTDGGGITIDTAIEGFHGAKKVGEVVLPAGVYARVAVSDNGPGIPADILPHIFEPFFTTKVEGSGTGIGLATCQSIAVEAGGIIEARNTENSGARFDVYIPAFSEKQNRRYS